jgi:phosphotransferase system enzyme I (PtsI)
MVKFSGKPVYKGIAVGPIVVLKDEDQQVRRHRVENPEEEIQRVAQAVEKAQEQLQKLYDKAIAEVGETSAAIFEVHQMMLEDDDYIDAIHNMIRNEQVNAEYAVALTGDNFAEMFAGMEDDYMKARSADVKDISNRLIRTLGGGDQNNFDFSEPSIIIADDISPSETVQMDKSKILAFVTVHGSANSHTAILARMMNIPALIGVPLELDKLVPGTTAVADGIKGEVVIEPNEFVLEETNKRIEEEKAKLLLLQEQKGKETVTLSGQR